MEIQYICPISNYKFKGDAIFVVAYEDKGNMVIVKKQLPYIGNVDDKIKAFPVQCNVPFNKHMYAMLFQLYNNVIQLMFFGILNTTKKYKNHKLFGVKSVIIKHYKDDSDFLSEVFFNNVKDEDNCAIIICRFGAKYLSTRLSINPLDKKDIYIYDKYSKIFIKEFIPNNVIKVASNDSVKTKSIKHNKHSMHMMTAFYKYYILKTNPLEFIKEYCIIPSEYTKLEYSNIYDVYNRQINEQHRTLTIDDFRADTITSPVDGRITVFKNTKDCNFMFNNVSMNIQSLITHPRISGLYDGCGFVIRTTPRDYPSICAPFNGHITNVATFSGVGINYGIGAMMNNVSRVVLRVSNEYFVQHNMHEREYISVLYGNDVGLSGVYPELKEPQKKDILIYYLVVIGFNNMGFKLKNGLNTKEGWNNIEPIYVRQGEEIGRFMSPGGIVIGLFNHMISYQSDIADHQPIETYIRGNDMLGYFE